MSDRTEGQQPDSNDDDNLDYLDAGLQETSEPDSTPTEVIPQQAAAPMAQQAAPVETVVVPVRERDRSWTWPVINVAGLAIVILINLLANTLKFNDQTTGDVVNKDPVPFQPAGWVFSIWGVIYALLILFAIYGLLPAGRRNLRLQRISPFFLIANIANAVWIFLWHWEQFFAALVTIAVLLVSLLCIYIGLRIRNPIRRSESTDKTGLFRRLVLWLPFSVYLGWAVVATLANLMVWMDRGGWDGGPLSYNWWAVVFMAAAVAIAAAFVFLAKDIVIPAVIAVALVGIGQHAWGDSVLVSVAAIIFAVAAAGLAFVAWVLAYNPTNDRGPLDRGGKSEPPPPEMTSVDDLPIERA